MDKLAQTHEKIEVVKTSMKENIQQLLLNSDKLEHIENATIHLNEQSQQFSRSSREMQRKMFWKMWKMRLIIIAVVLIILIIIIVPVAVTASKTKHASSH